MELSAPFVRFLSCAASRFQCTPRRRIFTAGTRPPYIPAAPPARRRFETVEPIPEREPKRAGPSVVRRPTNQQIPFEHVFVLDPITNKPGRTKKSLRELLETRERRVIELVASTPEPIVRVTTRAEVEERYREMRRALKKGTRAGEEPKEVQFTWGVAEADLEHKLRKAKRDLEKGHKVVVMVNLKKTHRLGRQEMMAFADEISEKIREVGQEWKDRTITSRLMTLSFRKVGDDSDSGIS